MWFARLLGGSMGSVRRWLERSGRLTLIFLVSCASWPLGDLLVKASKVTIPDRREGAISKAADPRSDFPNRQKSRVSKSK
jgi:hypothetical protein